MIRAYRRSNEKTTPQPGQAETGEWKMEAMQRISTSDGELLLTRQMKECLFRRHLSNAAADLGESKREWCENKNLELKDCVQWFNEYVNHRRCASIWLVVMGSMMKMKEIGAHFTRDLTSLSWASEKKKKFQEVWWLTCTYLAGLLFNYFNYQLCLKSDML